MSDSNKSKTFIKPPTTGAGSAVEKKYVLARDLYLSTSKFLIGNDVSDVQEKINETKLFDPIPVNGIYDEKTKEAVSKLQSHAGFNITGIVDQKLYNYLYEFVDNKNGLRTGIIINKKIWSKNILRKVIMIYQFFTVKILIMIV